MKAIETSFDGRRFRSRTEARWAVFLKELGLSYEYEPEGVVLDGTPYLPDFRVSEIKCWIEVKGQEPTDEERRKCELLVQESGARCLLAIGAPRPESNILHFPAEGGGAGEWFFTDHGKAQIAIRDRYGFTLSLGAAPRWMDEHHRLIGNPVSRAFEAAMSARFEFGETGEYRPEPEQDWRGPQKRREPEMSRRPPLGPRPRR